MVTGWRTSSSSALGGPSSSVKHRDACIDDLTWPTHGGSFRTLDLETRTAVLASWLAHDQWLMRNAVTAVLVLVAEGYTLHPDVLPLLRPHFRCAFGP